MLVGPGGGDTAAVAACCFEGPPGRACSCSEGADKKADCPSSPGPCGGRGRNREGWSAGLTPVLTQLQTIRTLPRSSQPKVARSTAFNLMEEDRPLDHAPKATLESVKTMCLPPLNPESSARLFASLAMAASS